MSQTPYPFESHEAALRVTTRTLFQRLATWYETFRVSRRESRRSSEISLQCISRKGQASLYPDELPLVFLVRNDRQLLPSFLWHYRKLGVTRFICVDDASSDGSREYLLEQDDVDLWVSQVRFKEARRGRLWREKLFSLYGAGRWYVNVDSDEFLIYNDFESKNLWSLVHSLEAQKFLRMPAPMLDMYPTDLQSARLEKLSHFAPWEIADHFDGDGYVVTTTKRGLSVKGGVRAREFGLGLELVKYPLIYWDLECLFGPTIHQPLPYDRNFVPVMGVLLHFKFFSNYADVVRRAAEGGQYFNNSSAYSAILETMQKSGSLRLHSEISKKYTGADQMVSLGFCVPVSGMDWFESKKGHG